MLILSVFGVTGGELTAAFKDMEPEDSQEATRSEVLPWE